MPVPRSTQSRRRPTIVTPPPSSPSSPSPPQTPPIPTFKVRGLAATSPILPGDTLISVPFHALLTLRTTIDHDPFLSTLIGPQFRRKYGWDGIRSGYYEVPLLIVAVLYHVRLGGQSPVRRYVDTLRGAPVDAMPFLWDGGADDAGVRSGEGGGSTATISEGARRVADGIRNDVRDMYGAVMGALIRDWPDVFGPPSRTGGDDDSDNTEFGRGGVEGGEGEGWAYSYDRFRWAFAMVNSRHWHVPVRDLDEGSGGSGGGGFGGEEGSEGSEGREARMRPAKAGGAAAGAAGATAATDATDATVAAAAADSAPVPAAAAVTGSTLLEEEEAEDEDEEEVDLPPLESTARTLSSIGTDGGIESPPAEQPTDAFVDQQVAGARSSDSEDEDGREGEEESRRVGHGDDDDDDGGGSVDLPAVGHDFHRGGGGEDRADTGTPTDPATARGGPGPTSSSGGGRSHSFLAPLADLLNFGPPCTRGRYDPYTRTFNVVATCPFLPGQEVTFHYSDDCEDVIFANYGFTHPMVPRCPSAEDWKGRANAWRRHGEEVEASLTAAYDEMDRMESDVDVMAAKMADCGCGGGADGGGGGDDGGQQRPTADQNNRGGGGAAGGGGGGGSIKPSVVKDGGSGVGVGSQQPTARRTLRREDAAAHHRELRGSVPADGGGTDGTTAATAEGHALRRLWHLDGRDLGDSL